MFPVQFSKIKIKSLRVTASIVYEENQFVNSKNIPLIFIRPSTVGTAANEPMPGWTDTIGLLQGVSLATGLGILRDLRGNGNLIADIVPVDFVAR